MCALRTVFKTPLLPHGLILAVAGLIYGGDDLDAWQNETHAFNPAVKDLGGLDLRVGLDKKTGWPRIGREMLICFDRHTDRATGGVNASRGASPIWFGTVQVPGAASPAVVRCERTWTGAHVALVAQKAARPLLTIHTSRLTPSIRIEAPGDLRLFAGDGIAGERITQPARYGGFVGTARPNWYATRGPGGIVVKDASGLDTLPLEDLGRNWLLCWYGAGSYFFGATRSSVETHYGWDGVRIWNTSVYPADCPLLILFDKPPRALEAEKQGGLRIESGGKGCRVLVLPIFGEFLPRASDTEKWSQAGLPKDLVDRCDWWAAHLDRVPTGVKETYAYNPQADAITLTESFTYAEFRPGTGVAAPVPPALGTASLAGFPLLTFSKAPMDLKMFTAVGDYMAVPDVTSYQMTFKGLGKYLAPRAAPSGAAPARLAAILEEEVKRIVAAGHLAPWARVKKNCDGWAGNFVCSQVHFIPGEIQYFLAEAMPYLSPPLQEKVRQCLRRETEQYPPYDPARPALPTDEGARREWYPLSPEFLAVKPPSKGYNNIHRFPSGHYFVGVRKIIMPNVPYDLAAYYAAVGKEDLGPHWNKIQAILRPYCGQLDWAAGFHQWPGKYAKSPSATYGREQGDWYGTGGMPDVNNFFAGTIGLARLARLAGDPKTETLACGLLARAAAVRYAFGKMTGRLYDLGLLTLAENQADKNQDIRVPYAVDEYGMSIRLKITNYQPNGLTVLRDVVPELGTFARDFLKPETMAYIDNMTAEMPHWYLSWVEQGVEDESGCPLPQDQYQAFMAYAWVAEKSAAWLEARLDLPWTERGDLYYLHKAVETLRAHQRESRK